MASLADEERNACVGGQRKMKQPLDNALFNKQRTRTHFANNCTPWILMERLWRGGDELRRINSRNRIARSRLLRSLLLRWSDQSDEILSMFQGSSKRIASGVTELVFSIELLLRKQDPVRAEATK